MTTGLAAGRAEYGLRGAEFFADPYPVYARIRAQREPVFDAETQSWLIARYDDVERLLRESRISKNILRATPTPFEMSVLFQDPPDHTRVRGLLNEAFSGNAISRLENRVGEIADRLIDGMRAERKVDFIAGFALPLPVAVIADLLGVPPPDTEQLHRWSSVFIADEAVPRAESEKLQYSAICAMAEYFDQLIARRRKASRDDVLGALIQARYEGGQLSPRELIGNCILLMVAGHETTVNLLGNGLLLLLQDPSRFERVKQQPELLPSAIEEALRYESPVQLGTFRVTTAPIEFGGRTLETGSMVTALIGAANRDPDRFPDPDRFDPERTPNRHLAFGMGPHRCLGAALARTEARVGFTRLLERLPNLQLDSSSAARGWLRRMGLPWSRQTPQPRRWRNNAVTRGLRELIVSW